MSGSVVDTLLRNLAERGAAWYGSEPVSVLQHSLQCALLAEQENAPPTLIAAALLHDYGHVLHDDETAAARGRDMRHEVLAAKHLARWFDLPVTQPVLLHVPAKRYLCTAEPGYYETLSAGSIESLRVQGGPFTPAEADAFLREPNAAEAVRLRRWDEQAKIAGLPTPDLEHYRPFLEASLRPIAAGVSRPAEKA
jgi:[1-hydroxy-2-(trimethylamino)ethyl]phosphonate dioxygenase